MKTRGVILATALIFSFASLETVRAQENLNALMQKCENMENVNVEVLFQKDPKTKKAERNIVTVSFYEKENAKLLEDFLAAFKKDREAAYRVIEDRKNGKVTPSSYRFASGNTDITYTFEYMGEKNKIGFLSKGDVRVTRIERYDFNYENQGGSFGL